MTAEKTITAPSGAPMPDRQVVQMATELAKLRENKASLERQLTDVNAQIETANAKLVEAMEVLQLDSFSVEGVGLFYLSESAYPQVKDQGALAAWLRQEQLGDLIKETVNWQTLRSLVNERLAEGTAVPAGVEVFHKTDVRVRRAGAKKETRT